MVTAVSPSQIAQRYQVFNRLASGSMGVACRAFGSLARQIAEFKQVAAAPCQLWLISCAHEAYDLRFEIPREFNTLVSVRGRTLGVIQEIRRRVDLNDYSPLADGSGQHRRLPRTRRPVLAFRPMLPMISPHIATWEPCT